MHAEGVATFAMPRQVRVPVDMFDIVHAHGLRLEESVEESGLHEDSKLTFNPNISRQLQQSAIARQFARYCLLKADLDDDDASIRRVARCVVLPRVPFTRSVLNTWDPRELRRMHRNATYRMICMRIPEVADATCTRISHDGQDVFERNVAPWLDDRLNGVQDPELALARQAAQARRTVYAGPRCFAKPFNLPPKRTITPGFLRVADPDTVHDRRPPSGLRRRGWVLVVMDAWRLIHP
jgi:hypothetical protein